MLIMSLALTLKSRSIWPLASGVWYGMAQAAKIKLERRQSRDSARMGTPDSVAWHINRAMA